MHEKSIPFTSAEAPEIGREGPQAVGSHHG